MAVHAQVWLAVAMYGDTGPYMAIPERSCRPHSFRRAVADSCEAPPGFGISEVRNGSKVYEELHSGKPLDERCGVRHGYGVNRSKKEDCKYALAGDQNETWIS